MKRITKRDLDEGYAVVLGDRRNPCLHFVNGKDVGNGLAVIYNDKTKLYSLTDIETGLRIDETLCSLSEINNFLNDDEKMKKLLNQIKKYKSKMKGDTLYKTLMRKEEKIYQFKD